MADGSEEVVLSASKMLRSEHANKAKNTVVYGKYADTMRAGMSPQISKKLEFYLHGKI